MPCTVVATSLNEKKAKQFNWYDKVKYRPLDLSKLDVTKNYFDYFDQPDILIHLAWEGLPNYKSLFHIEENLPRHYRFLSNLVRNGLKDVTVTGTCFEYGMQQGCLSEEMPAKPENPYAIAKDLLRRNLEELNGRFNFSFKWIRLFYMYGNGQNPKSLFAQLDKAIEEGDLVFNMSGGEQIRDYLPIENVAKYIVAIAMQQSIKGIVNCCSGKPVRLKDMVSSYLKSKGANILLNLGYYSYPNYEPMEFWGDDKKLKKVIKISRNTK